MSMSILTPAGAARGHAAAKAKRQQPQHQYRIEGEYVSRDDIANRLGVPAKVASTRLSRLKLASGAITWARLRGDQP